jgi:hypothetical protein
MPEEIRAAELTADHLGRRVRIDPGDQTTFVIGRLVRIRHKYVGFAATPETETRLEIEGPEDQLITVRFNAIGVIQLL